MHIHNGQIENVSCKNNSKTGYLIISLAMSKDTASKYDTERIQLNVNANTIFYNLSGACVSLCCLRPGMRINAVTSSRMTRSIPPQTNAFIITVLDNVRPAFPVSIGKIAFTDTEGGFLYTGNPDDINSQTKYTVTNRTLITNRQGFPINFDRLTPGQYVRITHADFMTASIPPQTTAYRIQLL